MAKVKTAAQGKIKIALFTGETVPADLSVPLTVTQLTAALNISCSVALNGFTAAAAASDTMSDPAVCEATNSQTRGNSNFTVALPIFWYVDPESGAYTAIDNEAYEALRVAGTVAAIAVRRHKLEAMPWLTGDRYDVFIFESDEPIAGDGQGYVKKIINGLPRSFRQDMTVADGA